MKLIKKTSVLAIALSLVACEATEMDTQIEEKVEKYTINTDWMDNSTSPGDDFFQFASGEWLANNPVPASEAIWGSFNVLDKENKRKLTILLEEALENDNKKGSSGQIIGDYYQAMKNIEKRNQDSEAQIEEIKEEIRSLESKEMIPNAIFEMNKVGIRPFYSLYATQDLKNVDNNILYISQGGIGLPNRNYYSDERYDDIRESYKTFMVTILNLFGYDNAEEIAKDAYAVEEKLASTMMKPEELRVHEDTYNKYDFDEAKEQFANFVNLDIYKENFGDDSTDSIIVRQPAHFESVTNYVNQESFGKLHNYITWTYVNHYAAYLNEDLVNADFDFYGKTLSGRSEMKPMNERAIEEMTQKAVKTALAQEFVEHYFSEEAKNKVNDLVDNLFAIYKERIENLSWMGEETKKEALKKLSAISRKLGYPDEWESLEELSIVPDSYMSNVNACATFSFNQNMNKLTKPVDKDEWGMPAHLVNAYYHPLLNEIAFPAGIMQAPFFDINAEDAVNYAGIGMVIGHELTHGFDDSGSKFAADGTFRNWWTEEDRENFEARTEKLGNTFEQFCPIEGHCINPQLTMGENIADLGGIKMAYYAYTLTDEYKENEIRKGFTPAQRFFIAYGQLWKINHKEEELMRRLATDPHSPGKYRVNGALMNLQEFFDAFDLKEGDKMRKSKEEIAEIW